MNRLNATFARLLLCLCAILTLAVPTVGYGQEKGGNGQENGRDRERRGRWGRDRDREDRDDDKKDETPVYVAPPRSLSPKNESMGFGKPKAKVEGRAFGAPQSSASGSGSIAVDRDRQWADRAMKKYDTNRDGHISDNELDMVKIAKYDKDSDGKVNFDELVDFSRGQPKSPTGAPLPVKSYRLLTAAEKLPEEGLPSWFNDRDRDHDGQVSMHEWSRSWNSSTVRDFTSKDSDGDGIITVAEVIEPAR